MNSEIVNKNERQTGNRYKILFSFRTFKKNIFRLNEGKNKYLKDLTKI